MTPADFTNDILVAWGGAEVFNQALALAQRGGVLRAYLDEKTVLKSLEGPEKEDHMKSRTLAFCAALASLLWLPASAGVTFDFEAASRRLFPKSTAASGANMLEGVAWSTAARISTDTSIPITG